MSEVGPANEGSLGSRDRNRVQRSQEILGRLDLERVFLLADRVMEREGFSVQGWSVDPW